MSAGFWIASICIASAVLGVALLLALNAALDAREGADEEEGVFGLSR